MRYGDVWVSSYTVPVAAPFASVWNVRSVRRELLTRRPISHQLSVYHKTHREVSQSDP
jgi:hypothetical protein